MHDLNTINRLNEQAHGHEILQQRAAGKHVVAVYEGLHLARHSVHDTQAEAESFQAWEGMKGVGVRAALLGPLTEAEAALVRGRDQSEDRAPSEVDPA